MRVVGIAGFVAAAIASTLHAQTNALRITTVGWTNTNVPSLEDFRSGQGGASVSRRIPPDFAEVQRDEAVGIGYDMSPTRALRRDKPARLCQAEQGAIVEGLAP